MPILGTNPPRPSKRPPLNPNVRCQSQQKPNLASEPGAPPEQHQVNTSSPAYVARLAKARTAAIKWLRSSLAKEGLGDVKVSDQNATQALIDKIAKAGK
jgi:anti-sigma factor RsiW